MLLLFFIVSALQQQSETAGGEEEIASGLGDDQSIVMIYMAAQKNGRVFPADTSPYLAHSGSQLEFPDSSSVTANESIFVFYMWAELPGGTQLRCRGLSESSRIEGFVVDRFGTRPIDIEAIQATGLIYQFGGS